MCKQAKTGGREPKGQHQYYRNTIIPKTVSFLLPHANTDRLRGQPIFALNWLFSSGTRAERFFTTLHNENSAKLRKHFFPHDFTRTTTFGTTGGSSRSRPAPDFHFPPTATTSHSGKTGKIKCVKYDNPRSDQTQLLIDTEKISDFPPSSSQQCSRVNRLRDCRRIVLNRRRVFQLPDTAQLWENFHHFFLSC